MNLEQLIDKESYQDSHRHFDKISSKVFKCSLNQT